MGSEMCIRDSFNVVYIQSPVLSKSCTLLLLIVKISDNVEVCRLIYQAFFKENFDHQPYLILKFDLQ